MGSRFTSSLKLFTDLHTTCSGGFWKVFFSASIRRLYYSFTFHVHSSLFWSGFYSLPVYIPSGECHCYSAAEATVFPLPATPTSTRTFTRNRHMPPPPLFYSAKKPHHSISLLVRQFSFLESPWQPCLWLLQAKSILFGCWWPVLCTALQVVIHFERRGLATAACCLSQTLLVWYILRAMRAFSMLCHTSVSTTG